MAIMLKVLRRLIGSLLALVVLYLAAAVLLGFAPVNRSFTPTIGGVPIVVCSNGVHTDLVLPVRTQEVDWTAVFPTAHFPIDVTGFDHIGIGWGDLDFYRSTPRWSDFDAGIAFKALTGLGPAALHVQYRWGPGTKEDCAKAEVSVLQYRALANYITGTITSTETPAAPGYGATDLFYPAQGRFSLFKTCNVWVGQGLKAAGLPAGLWTPFSFQVLSHL
jgi:uncharacterized protein (TIGR02117 family)